jgi:PAS domain-containing protein
MTSPRSRRSTITLNPLIIKHLAEVMALAVVRDIAVRRAADDAIIGLTLDGNITSWNEAAERMFGYSTSEMIEQSIRRISSSTSPERSPKARVVQSSIRRNSSLE